MKCNIAIFGGGSVNWCPGLIRDIYLLDEITEGEIRLFDPDSEGVNAILSLQNVYNQETNKDLRFRRSDSLEDLLSGADFVLCTFSPGSLEAFFHDLEVPISYGVRHPVSMSFGPTMISAAIRTVPLAEELAHAMTRYCPNAWLLNVTNPMTCVTTVMCRANRNGKVVGLCHEFEGQLSMVAEIVGHHWDHKAERGNDFARETLNAKIGGINHFIWLTETSNSGQDLYPKLRNFAAANEAYYADGKIPLINEKNPWSNNREAKLAMLRHFGYLPMAGDRHLVEYLGSLCNVQNQYAQAFNVTKTTIRERERAKSRNLARTIAIGSGEVSQNWNRSGEQVTDIMQAALTGKPTYIVANLLNEGQISNLQPDVAVETFAWFDASGGKAEPVGELPGALGPMIRHGIEVCELTLTAALEGSRQKLIEALTLDFSCQAVDFRLISKLADDLLHANKEWLPRFHD